MKARENTAAIRRVLTDQDPTASGVEIWRTALTGPSGQRSNILAAKIRYASRHSATRAFEVEILDSRTGFVAGYAARVHNIIGDAHGAGGWAIYNLDWDGTAVYLGLASSLPVGCDVLFNGPHAACGWGNHDTRRISRGTFFEASAGRVTSRDGSA